MTNIRRSDTITVFEFGIILALSIVFIAILSYVSASMEAAAYNRITGENVSTWDAMFVELRVDSSPKKKGS